jgi:hypothetical protein
MAELLKVQPIRPLANSIRQSTGPPLPKLIAEAFDLIDLNQNQIREAVRLLQGAPVTVIEDEPPVVEPPPETGLIRVSFESL